jgi:hypothetical protein
MMVDVDVAVGAGDGGVRAVHLGRLDPVDVGRGEEVRRYVVVKQEDLPWSRADTTFGYHKLRGVAMNFLFWLQ